MRVGKLEKLLTDFSNKNFIINGFKYGFRIGYTGNHTNVLASNAKSVNQNPEATLGKINEELKLGRLAGPFITSPFSYFKSCPLALRLKSNGNWRMLHNLSYPYNLDSVNLCIPEENKVVNYATIADAVNIIKATPHCFMAKTDIKDAFRIVPIHPDDRHLLGFSFQNKLYFDCCLPMGCSSACQIFEKVSDSLLHILSRHFNIENVVKYLDDFLFIAESEEKCNHMLRTFIQLCKHLGFPLAHLKTVSPTTNITFLGYKIDTIAMEVAIPTEKIESYENDIQILLQATGATLRDIRSIVGKLQFVTNVINRGKCFLRRLIDLTVGRFHPAEQITLNNSVKEDLKVWLSFIHHFNGIHIIRPPEFFACRTHQLFSDSSKKAYAGVFESNFICGPFPPKWRKHSIQLLELYPIYLLLQVFKGKLANSKVIFRCDNLAIVKIINKQSSKNPLIMKLLRPMIVIMLKSNIHFKALHINGKDNILADKLSRLQDSQRLRARYGLTCPTPVPHRLRPQNMKL